ncbi:MAG: hypothetical protein DMD96_03840 [Candidatus Rokuibacteriota bacterium]|nr:MAG: hypothetical protein DMD96_03840 [Candidatus Rokubacteria bacterium]
MLGNTPPLALLFAEAEKRLIERVSGLGARLDAGENLLWSEYCQALETLKRLVGEAREPLLTTKQLSEKLALTPRTIRRLSKTKKLQNVEEVRLGARGTGAIRWRA